MSALYYYFCYRYSNIFNEHPNPEIKTSVLTTQLFVFAGNQTWEPVGCVVRFAKQSTKEAVKFVKFLNCNL